jgi:hypothetical protein
MEGGAGASIFYDGGRPRHARRSLGELTAGHEANEKGPEPQFLMDVQRENWPPHANDQECTNTAPMIGSSAADTPAPRKCCLRAPCDARPSSFDHDTRLAFAPEFDKVAHA